MTASLKLDLLPVTQPSGEASGPAGAPASAVTSVESLKRSRPAPHLTSASSTPSPSKPTPRPAEPWREWSSFDRTVSYRLPPELVSEFEERIYQLRLPAGLTVAAALASLLDLDDEQLQARVTRAEAAKPRRRRPGGG
jgi:hypothetical protein